MNKPKFGIAKCCDTCKHYKVKRKDGLSYYFCDNLKTPTDNHWVCDEFQMNLKKCRVTKEMQKDYLESIKENKA